AGSSAVDDFVRSSGPRARTRPRLRLDPHRWPPPHCRRDRHPTPLL
ncbi:MAG: hypothetical protein AVDCRST_MAG36-2327, partial [uncultured Nocardioidaceae bacterium]